ncbi:MAG: hypothetical protein QG625_1625, partial [Cyanobacteriota bacterium erpe_2018_sw_39hr_WHONDRS-SW48-000098_B_bin.30]|nr:hypothetical protein [Cyanobacteriota bacterium erpe_2018_sw_39hr_WHONDRS-SW48-000098_B_bin.30]
MNWWRCTSILLGVMLMFAGHAIA